MRQLLEHLRTYLQLYHSINDKGVHINLIARINQELEKPEPEPINIEWPHYNYQCMDSGLEDLKITDTYEAMRYGWECALEYVAEALPDKLYTQPPGQQKPMTVDEIIEIYNKAATTPKNAWKITGIIIDIVRHIEKKNGISDKLYTQPPAQQNPLSDEQITKCYETTGHCQTLRPQDKRVVFDFARAIEAAHGIK